MKRRALVIALALSGVPSLATAYDIRDRVEVLPGGTLDIRLAAGPVEIETHDQDEVYIEVLGNARCRLLSDDGRDSRLLCGSRRGLFDFNRSAVQLLRVRVPERYSVDVRTAAGYIEIEDLEGEVRAATSAGSIQVDGAKGWVSLSTRGGSIRVENVRGDLDVSITGGSLRATEVTGRINARVIGGGILLDDVSGPVEAKATGGSIDARFVSDPGGSLTTEGGGIDVEFPEESSLTLHAETRGGRIQLESDIRLRGGGDHSGRGDEQISITIDVGHRRRVRGDINGGGRELRLSATGGNIRVSAR